MCPRLTGMTVKQALEYLDMISIINKLNALIMAKKAYGGKI